MVWAAVSISPIFKSAFFFTRSPSRPPPLERGPSLHHALELSRGLGATQTLRAPALMVVSILVALMQVACGSSQNVQPGHEDLDATSAAGFATMDAAMDAGLVQHTDCSSKPCRRVWASPTSVPGPNLTATARAASRPPPTPAPVPPPEVVDVRGFAFLCYDISANYRIHSGLGHAEALDWVQIAMNLETDGNPYIRPSDALTAWEGCR